MITVVDIIRALTLALKKRFPDLSVTDKDIVEGFKRPCLFIDVSSMRDDNAGELLSEECELELFYFSENRERGFLDLLKKQSELSEFLRQPIKVTEDFWIFADDVSFDLNKADKALITYLTVQTVQYSLNTDEPLMGELDVEI